MLINTEKTRKLPVKMTLEEIAHKAQSLTKALEKIDYAKNASKSAADEYKRDIKNLETVRSSER